MLNRGLTLLSVAILFEQMGCTLMKLSEGFERWQYAAAGMFSYSLCLVFFNLSLKHLDLSLACATWSALSIIISMIVGVLLFGEIVTSYKIFWAVVCLTGVIGLIFSQPA